MNAKHFKHKTTSKSNNTLKVIIFLWFISKALVTTNSAENCYLDPTIQLGSYITSGSTSNTFL